MANAPIRDGGYNLPEVLFVGLICFLIIWSIWGKSIEKKVYGQPLLPHTEEENFGAQIILSKTDSNTADLRVGHIYPNSPAEFAGLKTGDQIVGLDGRLVSSPEMARNIISANRSATALKVTIKHNDRNIDIYVRQNDQLPANKTLKSLSLSPSKQILTIIVFLVLTVLLFFYLYKNIESRMYTVTFFAVAVVLVGIFFRTYNPVDAFFAIKFNTISLLLGMGIISVVLDQAGFFDCVAYRIHGFAGTSRFKILILFCLMSFFFSLIVNNLTTILVIVPMTLNLSAKVGFDPRPIIIGEIIASNLGGASTMVGDFPNMLISAEAGIGFNQFIVFMMPVCLILLGILLVFLMVKCEDRDNMPKEKTRPVKIVRPRLTDRERKAVTKAISILCLVILFFTFSKGISVAPSAIALLGGLTLYLFAGINRRRILTQVGFKDIQFFIGLFIVVGSLETCGLLQYISRGITLLSFGKSWLLCLVLMWVAAFLTAFLSAGPTTALLFPVVLGIGIAPPHHVIWWALSLGVLAGSSASIVGATAGPVATSLLENFSSKYQLNTKGTHTITYQQFTSIGVPMMFMILAASSIYILCLCTVL